MQSYALKRKQRNTLKTIITARSVIGIKDKDWLALVASHTTSHPPNLGPTSPVLVVPRSAEPHVRASVTTGPTDVTFEERRSAPFHARPAPHPRHRNTEDRDTLGRAVETLGKAMWNSYLQNSGAKATLVLLRANHAIV
ncbi:hypothetical protein DPSP01_003441 [Paraphaeosphaeria sporulosa]